MTVLRFALAGRTAAAYALNGDLVYHGNIP